MSIDPPASFIAKMRQCERLANETTDPKIAVILRKLALAWRQKASHPIATKTEPEKGGSGATLIGGILS
jgi:hypothetical protein